MIAGIVFFTGFYVLFTYTVLALYGDVYPFKKKRPTREERAQVITKAYTDHNTNFYKTDEFYTDIFTLYNCYGWLTPNEKRFRQKHDNKYLHTENLKDLKINNLSQINESNYDID